jgi:hypothetical protein
VAEMNAPGQFVAASWGHCTKVTFTYARGERRWNIRLSVCSQSGTRGPPRTANATTGLNGTHGSVTTTLAADTPAFRASRAA